MSEATFVQSWRTAESTVYAKLLQATGTVDKKTAFLGYLPQQVGVWAFLTGPGGGNEQTLWTPNLVTIHIHAEIQGIFANRAEAQDFTMRVARILPILNQDTVQCFRIRMGGFPQPKAQPMDLGNENKRFLVWEILILCELVWNTGGSAD